MADNHASFADPAIRRPGACREKWAWSNLSSRHASSAERHAQLAAVVRRRTVVELWRPLMRLPIIPFLIAATILGTVVYLFNSTGSTRRILDVPRLTRLADIDGIETEISPSPDGARCVVVSDGDLWMLNLSDSTRTRITQTPDAESSPDWSPDGRQVTFTRGSDTFVIPADATSGDGQLFKANATELSWSPAGRQT